MRRVAFGEWFRALEIAIIAFGIGSTYEIYGGLINWIPFGFDPHFPQPQFEIVYLASVAIAIIIDLAAHPKFVKQVIHDVEDRGSGRRGSGK